MGFICSAEGRPPDPAKLKQLENWPAYSSEEDISSHLAFANYLREFLGPDFSDKTKPLRLYLKKDVVKFENFAQDKEAQEA